MNSLANTPPVPPQKSPNYVHTISDGSELKRLFGALWQGKWLIIIITLLFTVVSIVYALTAREWWSAKATVSQPQLQDIAGYQQVVKRYQPLFDVYQEDGTIIVSEVLDSLIDSEVIFKRFLQEFNANGTKRRFMQTNPVFIEFNKEMMNQDEPEQLQDFYEQWYKRIKALSFGKKEEGMFTLSFQSMDKASSLTLLNEYVQFVNQNLNQQLNDDLFSTLVAKYGELKQQEKNLYQQTQLRLQVELERTQYALNIAEAADIKHPVQNLGEQEIFAINIGSRALKAKVDALKSINDLSIFEPRLAVLQGKLSQFDLENVGKKTKWSVSGFYYLDQPELPLTRDKPKRALIVLFGILLGGILGIVIVLVRFASCSAEDLNTED
ncbi:TPA: LPS chain length-determining protein [Vibrio cholerae]|uniref:LPS O-antigen chain length determinant protein WzzB n=1 Tax=Vibrio cholerae TaxID=666 RepID=UPI0002C16163|nr:Wzz/FepE/Etk N-terminal domain-containing protein [Vibrio cholerae]EIF5160453.1 LPS O-antigen chain length determinant protein WzzB [Vibrio cholerae]EMQ57022.1 chain length determinant family protein [Vibrio cholerae O1 str. EM-1676A]BCN20096.1 putative O-antigen chain length determinant protein [Vibrio cholerae]GHZ39756.1 chain-length determining protein [Vibrio cholerae]HAS4283975.1 LPS chain length-determining protein [Vibrio cholerae]